MEKDPILNIEKLVKEIHDGAGKYTQPVLKRYPLLFAFLLTFSFASILHGFELLTDEYIFLKESPEILIFGGVLILFITGTLYKHLEKGE